MGKIRVAVNGYGTIGRRVADALLKQDDMLLVGVTKKSPDFRCAEARERNIDLYSVDRNSETFEKAGYEVKGDVRDLLRKVDVVVDCSPKNEGRKNLEVYKEFPELKAVFQGGEDHDLCETSFNSQSNYEQSLGKRFVRVVSCNTTALCRILSQLGKKYAIRKVRVALVRRSADPGQRKKKTIMNAWEPSLKYPSHHSVDVNKVIPGVKVSSLAGVAPMTLMHGHMIFIEFHTPPASKEEVVEQLSLNPRIKIVSSDQGFLSTAEIKEYAGSNGRKGNIYEICIWRESLGLDEDGELGLQVSIDQQADVIPENIDAIRAMFETAEAEESIRKTDRSLGIKCSQVVEEVLTF